MIKACLGATLVALASTIPVASTADTAADAERARAEIRAVLGHVPDVINAMPEEGLPGAWEVMRTLELEETALPTKVKALCGLAVAAQIPCDYCVYVDDSMARGAGATDREIKEALAIGALTRHWSTVLNGSQLSLDSFKAETKAMLAYTPPADMKSAPITDAESAYADISRTLGQVPEFLRAYPKAAIAGAWREMKGIQMNPNTALSGRDKELIGLAVAAQIPCSYCVHFHDKAARANGATDEQVKEAIAMSALVRHWSTIVNGTQIDLDAFRAEFDRIMDFTRKQASLDKK